MNVNMQTEPVAIFGALEVALIAILGAIAVVFEWDSEMVLAIGGLITAAILVLTTFAQRSRVDSPAAVEAKVNEALYAPVPEDGDGPISPS